MTTLAALFGGASYGLSGGSKKTAAAPPINASSPDEADFIKYTPVLHPSTNSDKHANDTKQEIHGGSGGRLESQDETLDG